MKISRGEYLAFLEQRSLIYGCRSPGARRRHYGVIRWPALLLLCLVLVACRSEGGVPGNPLGIKLQWFSFIDGDGFRDRCVLERGVADGTLRHVGFTESIHMIADALGWRVDRVTESIVPKITERAVASDLLAVDPGYVCGIIQDGVGYVNGEARITLHLEAYLGAPESYDSVLIEGLPRIHSTVAGGVHGDIATASMVLNMIPAVLAAAPGLRTMRELRLPSYYAGR